MLLWLVPAQDGPFFYTRFHFSAVQNCALIFSIYFLFIFIFKRCITQFSHWIVSCAIFFKHMIQLFINFTHSFVVHSNESACRKVDVLGWNKSNNRHRKPPYAVCPNNCRGRGKPESPLHTPPVSPGICPFPRLQFTFMIFYGSNFMENIPSLKDITNVFFITVDTDKQRTMMVHLKIHTILRFSECGDDLYY